MQAKINIFSHFSILFIFFFFTKWYKSRPIYILDLEVEPIPNIEFVFGYDHSGCLPPKKLRQGSTLSGNFGLKLLPEVAHFQSPFLLFHGLHDEKKQFSFSIKIEGVTVPPHFLQNGGCDVIKMSFFKR